MFLSVMGTQSSWLSKVDKSLGRGETLKIVLKGVQQDLEVENGKDYFEVLRAPHIK